MKTRKLRASMILLASFAIVLHASTILRAQDQDYSDKDQSLKMKR